MEQLPTTTNEVAGPGGWEIWDAPPRDGPSVFVIDRQRLDERQELHGLWIDPTKGPQVFGAALASVIGREPAAGSWSIVDQVGLGAVMLPESFPIEDLDQVLAELASCADVVSPSSNP